MDVEGAAEELAAPGDVPPFAPPPRNLLCKPVPAPPAFAPGPFGTLNFPPVALEAREAAELAVASLRDGWRLMLDEDGADEVGWAERVDEGAAAFDGRIGASYVNV